MQTPECGLSWSCLSKRGALVPGSLGTGVGGAGLADRWGGGGSPRGSAVACPTGRGTREPPEPGWRVGGSEHLLRLPEDIALGARRRGSCSTTPNMGLRRRLWPGPPPRPHLPGCCRESSPLHVLCVCRVWLVFLRGSRVISGLCSGGEARGETLRALKALWSRF